MSQATSATQELHVNQFLRSSFVAVLVCTHGRGLCFPRADIKKKEEEEEAEEEQ